jgi:hypothetical protein
MPPSVMPSVHAPGPKPWPSPGLHSAKVRGFDQIEPGVSMKRGEESQQQQGEYAHCSGTHGDHTSTAGTAGLCAECTYIRADMKGRCI